MKFFNPSFGADAEYFTQQYAGNGWNDLNGSAQNPMNSSAGTSYGGTADPFSHSYRPSDPTIEYFIVSCIAPTTQAGGSAAISAVAGFTLEPVQQGFGCASKITTGYDPVVDRAVFTNGGAAFYSAMWIALAGTAATPPLSASPTSLAYISHEWGFSPAIGDGVGDDGTDQAQQISITASGAWTLTADQPWVLFNNKATLSGSGNASVSITIRDKIISTGESLFPDSPFPQFAFQNGTYTANISVTGSTTVTVPIVYKIGLV